VTCYQQKKTSATVWRDAQVKRRGKSKNQRIAKPLVTAELGQQLSPL